MSDKIQTLIVDDDKDIRFFLQEVLSGEGHAVVPASSGEEALQHLRDQRFDLAFLDLNLGGRIDGMRVLEAINWRWPQTATVILTGHGTLESAMNAIREGIGAYLLKPAKASQVRQVAAEVLSKRKEPYQPKATAHDPSRLQRGPFAVNLDTGEVRREDQVLELNSCEYKLLVHLMEHDERPVPVEELVNVVRGYQCEHVHEARDIIKWYVYSLRQKVERNPSAPRHILNVRGVGYTFKT
ncbi:MAG: response regulator transcription factor [Anaerolineae bacterium]|jgi:DNA-binding response OmpR family regulator